MKNVKIQVYLINIYKTTAPSKRYTLHWMQMKESLRYIIWFAIYSLNKCQSIEIIQTLFSDHKESKVESHRRNILIKSQNI